MKILFYTTFEVSPQKGGTERVTTSVAQGLTSLYGVECYSAFSQYLGDQFEKTPFAGTVCVPKLHRNLSKLTDYIIEKQINVVILQAGFELTKPLRESLPSRVKVIFVHHYAPSFELIFSYKSILKGIKNGEQVLKNLILLGLYPWVKYRHDHRTQRFYAETLLCADRVVLLSMKFKQGFLDYARMQDRGNIRAINNALSFKTFFEISSYAEFKKKEVLIVSRLSEAQKKISLSLKVWELIEHTDRFNDWRLVIVGHGEYEREYKQYVKKHGLKNISFEGMQQPEPYYERSSIFMMTSYSEGWGLTLTEAQQYACVPIAFQSYASVTDIITHGENGLLVPYPDIKAFATELAKLMDDVVGRRRMAEQGLLTCKRFEQGKICQQWKQLLDEVIEER